ncbi:MAG: hypothetical protein M3Z26_18250, partial [Bacteroidota bacterium]|nr:hypothetical protein [Bacteroidota bacterium]
IYVGQLQKNGIDTVCIYQDYCVGCMYSFKKDEDKCDFNGWLFLPSYIIWLDKGVTFMTKKDNCFDYSTITLSNTNFWKFYFSNKDTINNQEIKMPEFVEIKNGKEQVYFSTIDHSYHQTIKMFVGQNSIDKDLNDYYFSKEIGVRPDKNINYAYNINSPLKKLQVILGQTIKDETKKQPLIKTRR